MGLVLNLGLVVETISAGHAPVIVAQPIDTVRWSLVVGAPRPVPRWVPIVAVVTDHVAVEPPPPSR